MDNKYPEHEKLQGVKDQSQFLGSFLEWASGKGYFLAERVPDEDYPEDREVCVRVRKSINQLLAEYHDIDLGKLDAEKRKMLEAYRESS